MAGNAFVVLVMKDPRYACGAIALVQSLKAVGSQSARVCMCTDDISAEYRAALAAIWRVVDVPYITQATVRLKSDKQRAYYESWHDQSYTKWNCLGLVDYARVVLCDADMIFVRNPDELFELQGHAACYSNPWAEPWAEETQRGRGRGIHNPYLDARGCAPKHGELVSIDSVNEGAHGCRVGYGKNARTFPSFVGGGFLVLLNTSAERLDAFREWIARDEVFGTEYCCTSTADEITIAMFMLQYGPWRNIDQGFAAIPWKKKWINAACTPISGWHYFGKKLWDLPLEYPDYLVWWDIIEEYCAEYPMHAHLFARPTEDARRAVLNKRSADVVDATELLRSMML